MHTLLGIMILALQASLILAWPAVNEKENRQQTEAIRKYLKENFGYPGMETSWYPNITYVSVIGRRVAVNTKLSRTSAARDAAKAICQAASGFVYSKENRSLGIEHIQVLGADGGVVVSPRGFTDRCEAR